MSENRHQRRALAAVAKNPHPTSSFVDLVGQSNRDALKPYIDQVIAESRSQLARQQLASLGNILTRLSVLEKLALEKLGETEASLSRRTAAEQDRALGYEFTLAPAKVGDTVRVSIMGYNEGETPNEENRVRACMRKLAVPPFQHLQQVEEAVIGMSEGESKVITVDTGSTRDEATQTTIKNTNVVFNVLVESVSVPVKADEASNENA